MLNSLTSVALFGSAFLSVINILAGVAGWGPVVAWFVDLRLSGFITVPLALFGIGYLLFSWLESGLSNSAGMAIYLLNVVVAPFGYVSWGLPLWLGIALSLSPIPFYSGVNALSDFLHDKFGRRF